MRAAQQLVRRRWLHALALAAVTGIVFGNTLKNELHLDSIYRVRDNAEIERFWPPWRHFVDPRTSTALSSLVVYRPMLPLSLTVNRAISDWLGVDRLAGFHVGNIAIHLACCLVVYLLLSELLEHWCRMRVPSSARNIAFFASLLFAVHPISGATVNYVCARDLLMMLLFLMGSLLVYFRMRRRGQSLGGWVVCLALLALSLLSKQNSVVAPLLLLAFEIVVAKSTSVSRKSWIWPLVVVAVVSGYFGFTWLALGIGPFWSGGTLPPWAYAGTMLRAHVLYYLRNFAWPFRMRALPTFEAASGPLDPGVVAGALLLISSLLLAVALRNRRPVASWAILAYWILFAPTSSIQPFRFVVLDYRQYPSLAFLCLLVVLGLWHLPKRHGALVAAVLVVYFGASTFHINTIWRTEESFWEQSVRYGALPMAHLAYARTIQDRSPDLAEEHYERALRAEPRNVYALFNLAFLRIGRGDAEEGVLLARRAVEFAPDWGFSHFWLAEVYRSLGRTADAAAASRRAADLDEENVEYQYVAALDLQEQGGYAASLGYLRRVAERSPGYELSVLAEGSALQELNRWEEAERRYRQFLAGDPDQALAWFNLGRGLEAEGRFTEAIDAFEEVLRLDPEGTFSAHHWLSSCYLDIGDAEAAARHALLHEAANR